MNVNPEAQIRLLDLQALDSRLDRLAHRRRTLSEHEEIERLKARLGRVRDLVVAAETEQTDIAREQSKAERDVDQVRTRAQRDQQRLDSGQVSSPKELESLQHELVTLHRRQSDLEDAALEVMQRGEDTEHRLTELAEERRTVERDLAEAEQRREEAYAEIDGEAAEAATGRKQLAADIPQELLALYARLREQHDGVGAAAIRLRRCEGCRLELDTAELARIRAAPPDEVIRCDSCRRILVRTPESAL